MYRNFGTHYINFWDNSRHCYSRHFIPKENSIYSFAWNRNFVECSMFIQILSKQMRFY